MNPQDFFTSSLKYPHFFGGAFLGGPRWFHSHDSNLLQSGDRCKWHVWIWPHSWDINIAMTLVDVQHHPEMGVSSNGGTPKWMVYNGKPYSNGWFGGTTIFGNIQICRWFCLMCFVRYARCPKKTPAKNSEMQFVDWRESEAQQDWSTLPETHSVSTPDNRPCPPQKERRKCSNHSFCLGAFGVSLIECCWWIQP